MASPSGQALDQFLRQQFDVLQYLRDNFEAIRRVADHLTPVEDLVDFREQIEDLHAKLGLLVEASELIILATDAGLALLHAADVPAQRAALGLGTAALRSEAYFATAEGLATLQTQVTDLSGVVDALLLDIQTRATNADLAALAERMDAVETNDGFNARINALIDDLLNGVYSADLEARLDQLTLVVESMGSDAAVTLSRTDALEVGFANLLTGQTALGEAIDSTTVRVSATEDGIDVLTTDLTALGARVTNAEGTIESQGTAIDTLSTQVTDINGQQTVTSNAVTALTARVADAETGLVAEGAARETLGTRVTNTEDGLEVLSTSVTELTASITSTGNLLPNSAFEVDTRGWEIHSVGDWVTPYMEPESPFTGELSGVYALMFTDTTAGERDATASVRSAAIPVEDGTYIVSGYLGALACTGRLEYRLYDNIGDEMGFGLVGSASMLPADLRDWPRISLPVPVTVGAVTMRLLLQGTEPGSSPALWLLRPMVEKAAPGQTEPSPWTPSIGGLEESLATAMTVLEARVTDAEAVASSVTELTSRLGTAEGALVNEMITRSNQHGSTVASLNALSASMLDVESGLETQGLAIQSLETEVTALDGTVSSHSSSLTSLQAQVNAMDTDTGGYGSAISALDTRVSMTEDEIDSMSTAITALESSVTNANKIYAQNDPPPTAGGTTGDLWIDTNDNNKVYTLSGGVWVARPDNARTKIFVQATQPTAFNVGDLWIETDNGNKPWYWNGTTWIDAVDARTTANATAISSLTTRTTAAENEIDSVASAVTAVTSRVTTAEGNITSQASATSSLTTRVTTVEGKATVMQAKWTVNLDVNGYISGVTSVNDGASASFEVRADKFSVVVPGGGVGLYWTSGVLWNKGTTNSFLVGHNMGTTNDVLLYVGPNPASAATLVKTSAKFYVDKDGNIGFSGSVRESNFDMRSTVIDCGGGRQAPLMINDITNGLTTTSYFAYLYSPDYSTGYSGTRLAHRRMDVFINAFCEGWEPSTYLTSFAIQVQYDAGAWTTIYTRTVDLANGRAHMAALRYTTTETAWNTVRFRILCGTGVEQISGNLQINNMCPSSNDAGSSSNPATGGSGGGSGGGETGGGGTWCVTEAMYLAAMTQANQVEPGELYPTYSPEHGHKLMPVLAVGMPVLQHCVRITSACGAILDVSRDTPFDLFDGTSALAHDMFDRLVLTKGDRDPPTWECVVSVEDIGWHWVVPISFGGLSFAAGLDPRRLIYSHNMAKPGV